MFAFARILYANSNPICRRTYDNLLQVLQPPVWTQLARLEHSNAVRYKLLRMEAYRQSATFGPISEYLEAAERTLEVQSQNKIWLAGQYRDLAIAAVLLKKKEVIAVPTDTVYGLACLANETKSIQKLYNIKGRDPGKPLAICVGKIEDISKYGIVTNIVNVILNNLLPGPYTFVLKRTESVHKDLNPDHDTIAIRVPDFWFIRTVVDIAGPIALTSANKSGQQSCISIDEFSDLWPELGGVFHYPYLQKTHRKRLGSTIIDLSIPGEYKILRYGHHHIYADKILRNNGLRPSETHYKDLRQYGVS